jgi:hypothetical protein
MIQRHQTHEGLEPELSGVTASSRTITCASGKSLTLQSQIWISSSLGGLSGLLEVLSGRWNLSVRCSRGVVPPILSHEEPISQPSKDRRRKAAI